MCARLVPYQLNEDEKIASVAHCRDIIQTVEHDSDFLDSINLRINTLLVIFYDSKGIVHKEFVPGGETVNGKYYLGVLHPGAFGREFFEYPAGKYLVLLHDYTARIFSVPETENNVSAIQGVAAQVLKNIPQSDFKNRCIHPPVPYAVLSLQE
ncbi:hypothetical protein Trydic_g6848 [Trypoxylus dichotomus]